MKIIIVGCGKVGYAIAQQLTQEKHDITVVDDEAAHLNRADSTLDVLCIHGNGASITRAAEGDKRYSVRLKDLIKRGDISANVEMKPGDVLIIPQGWF